MTEIIWIFPLFALIVCELIADIFSERYVAHHTWPLWIAATLFYLVGNIFWLWSMKNGSGLARGAIIFSVVSAIAAILIGVRFFGEHVTHSQLFGMVLGIVALAFILT